MIFVNLKEFNHSLKIFKVPLAPKLTKKKPVIPPAMLTFNDGFLSIEYEDKLMNIHAEGEWHGKAEFSGIFLQALVHSPISANPVCIEYKDEKIIIATAKTPCRWTPFSQALIKKLNNPSAIDVIAIRRTLPADVVHADGVDEKYKEVNIKMLKDSEKAAKLLATFEVTQQDILDLIELKVEARSRLGI